MIVVVDDVFHRLDAPKGFGTPILITVGIRHTPRFIFPSFFRKPKEVS